jgi:hypothetical protein
MDVEASLSTHEFDAHAFEPATFIERGVNVPFTTPIMLGARARPHDGRGGLELVFANPSGGEGYYIIPWSGLPQICVPTLHDRRLWTLLRDELAPTPRLVREAAELAALEGYAGRAAAAAVQDVRTAREARGRRINYGLVLMLIVGTEDPNAGLPPPEVDSPENVALRSQRAVKRCAEHLGMQTEKVADALAELSSALTGLGLPEGDEPGPWRRLMAELILLSQSLEAWREAVPEDPAAGAAELLEKALSNTLKCAVQASREFNALLADPTAAVRAWLSDRREIIDRLTQLDWLLDGWEIILGVWKSSPADGRTAAVMEMALLAPILPAEVAGWYGLDPDWRNPRPQRGLVQQFQEWRRGHIIDLVARNENLITDPRARNRKFMLQRRRPTPPPPGPSIQAALLRHSGASSGGKHGVPAKNRLAETRRLSRALATASDTALHQVIDILDRLPDRTDIDRLLDAARPRLRLLRPPRRLALTRLLFQPLNGAIVDSGAWKRGSNRLPRSALPALADSLRMAMGSEGQRLEASFANKTFRDRSEVEAGGRILWAAAAALAPQLRPTPRWETTGLRPQDFAQFLHIATGVWRHAMPIWAAMQAATWGPPEDAVQDALAPLAEDTSPAFDVALATLMKDATNPGRVVATAARLSPRAASVADAAVDAWLDEAKVELPDADLVSVATAAETFGRAFDDIKNAPPNTSTQRAKKVRNLRREADTHVRAAYDEGLKEEILRQLPSLAVSATQDQMLAIEEQARALRRLEMIGRSFGAQQGYDSSSQRIRAAIEGTKSALAPGGMTKLDLARLAEILIGGEAALDILG